MLKVILCMKEAVKLKPVTLCLLWYSMHTEDYSGKTHKHKYGQMGFTAGSCMTYQVTKDEGLLRVRIWMTICLFVNAPVP